MANVQVKIDDNLCDSARTVAAGMGLDLASAVRMFLTQMVRENGMPFKPSGDPFYSARNLAALDESIAQIKAGRTVTKTLADLDGVSQ